MKHFEQHSIAVAADAVKNDISSNELILHAIAHSHNDVGWLKTKDTYYNEQVKFIIGNVVQELKNN
jgi:hypothetical protein